MNFIDLEKAAALNSQLKSARSQQEALAGYKVVGVIIDTGEGGLRPFTIDRNAGCGTGSISSIGWSAELSECLTEAFHRVFAEREKAALKMLETYGVTAA